MATKAFINNEVQKRMEAEFRATGFKALEMGYANGYVAVSPDHPLHGLIYDRVYDVADLSVWGGLTFSEQKADCEWNGASVEMIGGGSFDDIPADWWIFGFDTMHFNDGPEHDREWCIRETRQLQLQLEAIKTKEG